MSSWSSAHCAGVLAFICAYVRARTVQLCMLHAGACSVRPFNILTARVARERPRMRKFRAHLPWRVGWEELRQRAQRMRMFIALLEGIRLAHITGALIAAPPSDTSTKVETSPIVVDAEDVWSNSSSRRSLDRRGLHGLRRLLGLLPCHGLHRSYTLRRSRGSGTRRAPERRLLGWRRATSKASHLRSKLAPEWSTPPQFGRTAPRRRPKSVHVWRR